jgi:PAS domain S-box-containing protein
MTKPRNASHVPDVVHTSLLGEGADCAEVGVAIYDDDGRYVAVNAHACDMLGYTRDELLTHDVGDFTEGGIDRTVLKSPDRREGARLVRRKDGHFLAVAFVVTPTKIANIDFNLSVFWELPPGDPRAASAS